MVETVVLRGIPQYVTVLDLADNLDKVLDRKINKYRICELPDAKERLVALKFELLDDAVNARKLLDGYKYILPGADYVLNAEFMKDVPITEQRVFKSSLSDVEVKSSPSTLTLESDYIEEILSSPAIEEVVVVKAEKSAKRKNAIDEKSAKRNNTVDEKSAKRNNTVDEKSAKRKYSIDEKSAKRNNTVDEKSAKRNNTVDEKSAKRNNTVDEKSAKRNNTVDEKSAKRKYAVDEKSAKRKNAVDEKMLGEPKPKCMAQYTPERTRSRDRHGSPSPQSRQNRSRSSTASTSSRIRGCTGIDYSPRNRFESPYENAEPTSSYNGTPWEYRPNLSEKEDPNYCNIFKARYNKYDFKTTYKPTFDDRQSYKPTDYRNGNRDIDNRPKTNVKEDGESLTAKIKKAAKTLRKELKFTLVENCRKGNISKTDKKLIKRNLKGEVKKRMERYKQYDARISVMDIIKSYKRRYSEADDRIMVKKLLKEISEMSLLPELRVNGRARSTRQGSVQTVTSLTGNLQNRRVRIKQELETLSAGTNSNEAMNEIRGNVRVKREPIKTEEDKFLSAVDEVLQDLPFDLINSEDTNAQLKSRVKVDPDRPNKKMRIKTEAETYSPLRESRKRRNEHNTTSDTDQVITRTNVNPGPWILINESQKQRRSIRPKFTKATKILMRDLKPLYNSELVEEAMKYQFLAKAPSVIRLRLLYLMKNKEYTKTPQICLLYRDLYGVFHKETGEDFVKLIVRVLKEGRQANINVTYSTATRKIRKVKIKQEIEALPDGTNSNEEMNEIQEKVRVKQEHSLPVNENVIESKETPQVNIKQEPVETNADVPDMETTNSPNMNEKVIESIKNPQVHTKQENVAMNSDVNMDTTNSLHVNENVIESEQNAQVNIKQEHVETNADVPDMETTNTLHVNENVIESEQNPQVNIKQEHVETNVDVPDMETTNSLHVNQNVIESEQNPRVNIKQEHVETNVDAPDMETTNSQHVNENVIESEQNAQVNIKQEPVETNVDVPDMETTIIKTEEDKICSAVNEE